ncbi:FtsK/SpoIIIE domain-containing protein [Agromyces subbeticus]|uniref:FtsK/SpoIIIE domain-containing protein n=1 Tax=Agromyces subbeticus TaxID=293890 RepID=UPI0003B6C0FA|nr:FtsK/SpoIIIE domain-containing protein [Agromyces subbeticus]
MNRIQRISVKLPKEFDADRHVRAMERKVTDKHGAGWELSHIDPAERVAIFERQTNVAEVTRSQKIADTLDVSLPKGSKPADGDRIATKYEAQYDGYVLTRFEPYLGTAVMSKLRPETIRARGAIANVLGVKPWEVQIRDRVDGGFDLILPNRYSSSKHDEKLLDTVENDIGSPGWYVVTNSQKLTASIIPAEPPSFPAAIKYPFGAKITAGDARLPIGVQLGKGKEPGPIQYLDLDAAPHSQVSGTSGSGKTVGLNAMIAGALARGMELVVVDLPSKSVDFLWCKPYVRPGGWGCDSLKASVATMSMLYEEGGRRAALLAEHRVTKIVELPARLRPPDIFAVVDEVTGLFMQEAVPRGLPKDHELVIEPQEVNLHKAVLESKIAKAAAELRFVGIKLVLSSQVSSTTTGVSTAIRLNLANKMLLGTNPTDNNRKMSLSDSLAAPKVPDNIRSDESGSGRGVGVTEFEGQKAAVFKSYYASTTDYAKWLAKLGVSRTDRPAPTPTEIARYTPSLDDRSADVRQTSRFDEGGFGQDGRDAPAPRLKGAAAAAQALKAAETGH